MGGIGTTELLIIFAVILLLFGGARLPQLARSLGSSIKEFKKAQNDTFNEISDGSDESKKQKFCQDCGSPLPEGSDKCPKCQG